MFTRHNHTIPAVNAEGQIVSQRATCADAQAFYGTHTGTNLVDDGQGGTRVVRWVVSCLDAETERQALLGINAQQATTIEAQAGQIETLTADVANYKRLVAGAMQIVFHMGPALQNLLAEDLADPNLTDDGTAVKVENVLFTVLIDPFQERITVRSVEGRVPERSFAVVNGRLSEDAQTLLLGHVDRIRKAEANGSDPVQKTISLVQAA